MPTTKKDYLLVAIIGFLFGLLIVPILQNLKLSFWQLTLFNVVVVVVSFTIVAIVALWAAGLIAKKIPVIMQFAKFGAVGALGTVLDFGVLNFLIYLTAISAGGGYSAFKGVSFLVANINSYFWNKHWAFKKEVPVGAPPAETKTAAKEYSQFLVVSVVGFILNVGIATLIVNVWGQRWGVDAKLWANVGAFGGTLVGLLWNFLGYKLIVFKG
ncbi:MAG TPA: hypothetical protein DHI91_02420 [Candidatus Portnoybacteria bacterium]|nr:hypothetical protein [Candidatus Portnoybacteria bacterium]